MRTSDDKELGSLRYEQLVAANLNFAEAAECRLNSIGICKVDCTYLVLLLYLGDLLARG